MNDDQAARMKALSVYHQLAVQLLTFDCVEPDNYWGRLIRRWAQQIKWRLVDGIDPQWHEVELACRQAVDKAHGR